VGELLRQAICGYAEDAFDDVIQVVVNFTVPVAECHVAGPLKVIVTQAIASQPTADRMLNAVDLNDQPRAVADEIEDVAIERSLPAKVKPV
jgi:hypothetical protein